MGRPKKTEAPDAETPEVKEVLTEQSDTEMEKQSEIEEPAESSKEEPKSQESLPANVIAAMRLYPQYEEIWITPRGFVHPAGVPQYLLKGAKLYKNKFYNK